MPAVVAGGAPAYLIGGVDESGTWSAAAGVSDIRTGASARADAEFRIGSISKTFVAVAILQLVQQGKIGLDTPIDRYLPGLLTQGATITIRELLQHRAGLADSTFPDVKTVFGAITRTCATTYDPVSVVKGADQQLSEPGTTFSYSNPGYVALELVIERVTGRPYERVLADQIIRPLGLTHTSFQEGAPHWTGPFLHGYVDFGPNGLGTGVRDRLVDETTCNTSIFGASGSGISTTRDLTTFMRALIHGRLIHRDLFEQMIDAQPTDWGPNVGYGLGMVRETVSCGLELIGNSGAVFGYQSDLLATIDGARTMADGYSIYPGSSATWQALADAERPEFCGPPAT